MTDRHARHRRTPMDPRRRPCDGSRAASATRFTRIVDTAMRELPPDLHEALKRTEIRIVDVPPADATEPVLSRCEPGRSPGEAARLTLYRRPLEAHAISPADLTSLIVEVIARELDEHFDGPDRG